MTDHKTESCKDCEQEVPEFDIRDEFGVCTECTIAKLEKFLKAARTANAELLKANKKLQREVKNG